MRCWLLRYLQHCCANALDALRVLLLNNTRITDKGLDGVGS